MIREESLDSLRRRIREEKPLIHCITNPISIHDCANIILAAGARPIMAEHPLEVEEITATARALMLNLGNITDVRMESMERSLRTAKRAGIPVLLDLVGVSCSRLRNDFSRHLLDIGGISIIKGNMSEILTAAGLPSHTSGIDAGKEDVLNGGNLSRISRAFGELAGQRGCVVMATGPEDLITDGKRTLLVANGTEKLSGITGTGCMLGALTSAFLPGKDAFLAALLGAVLMGTAGELAGERAKGPGSFQAELLDEIYGLTAGQLAERMRVREADVRGTGLPETDVQGAGLPETGFLVAGAQEADSDVSGDIDSACSHNTPEKASRNSLDD